MKQREKSRNWKEFLREMSWIYQYGIKYKGSIFVYILLGFLGVVLSLTAGLVSKYVFDVVLGRAFSKFAPVAACYVGIQVLNIVCRAISERIAAKVEVKVDQEIRADVYNQIMETDWESMSDFHSGDLLNRVDNDVSSVSSCVIGWLPNFVTRSLQFVGSLAIIVYYDVTLAMLALLSAPVTMFVSRFLTRRMRKHNQKMREISSEVMTFNEESFRNLQMIKAFGLTDLYGEKLRNVQQKYRESKLEFNQFAVYTNTMMSLMGTVVSCVCLGWSIYRLWGGYISYGTMVLFLQLSSMLGNSFQAIARLVPSLISATTAAGRVMTVVCLPKEKRLCESQAEELRTMDHGITVEGKEIKFSYKNGRDVFDKADFVAKPGEVIAVVGTSGEGKTTLLRLLLGVVYIQDGELNVSTDNYKVPISAATRALFSYVPQDNTLFAGTVAENLRLVKPDATDEELDEVLKIACAYHFVHRRPEGLYAPVKEHGGGFSEGQIQRLSIARAMLSDAPVLLLDEATSALDAETEQKVIENIMAVKKNRTCIVTTHRSSMMQISDRVYRIADGKIKQV